MTTFDIFQNFVSPNQSIVQEQTTQTQQPQTQTPVVISEALAPVQDKLKYFDLNQFIKEVYKNSTEENKIKIKNQKYMSAYDIASTCIQNILHKLRNTPIPSYSNKWLPIVLRSYIGKSIHDFIQQNSKQFTELECSLKIPSIRFSGRIDNLINNNVLVEIKSLPYKDYRKVIKNQTPRINDFYQTLVYKYIIENYLHEAQTQTEPTRTSPPKLSNYNIEAIQYIYVAHDIFAADVETLDEAIQIVDQVKKALNSKHNSFYFMSNMVLELKDYDLTEYLNYIKTKIAKVNYYLDNNLEVDPTDEFIDKKSCFFCLFSNICQHR